MKNKNRIKTILTIFIFCILVFFSSCNVETNNNYNNQYKPNEYTDCKKVAILSDRTTLIYVYIDNPNDYVNIESSFCKELQIKYDENGTVWVKYTNWFDSGQEFKVYVDYFVIVEWR